MSSAAPKLSVEIVTGERVVYSESDVDMVIAPGAEGQLGILPRHAALFTLLSGGELRIRHSRGEEILTVFGGFLEVSNDRVLILSDSAERIEELDVARAEAARQRAEEAIRTARAGGGGLNLAQAEAELRRARVRIAVANRHGQRVRRPQPGAGRTPPGSSDT